MTDQQGSQLPSPIVPLDVAVVDDDLLWRAELMNAVRPLYADDFVVVGEALDHIGESAPCVLLIGPAAASEARPLLAAAKVSRPFLRIVVVEGATVDAALEPSTTDIDALVAAGDDTTQIVAAVGEQLGEARIAAASARTPAAVERDTTLIVVTAAKAGEGSTAVAVGIARAIQRLDRQVTLVETDPTFGDIAMRLGLRPTEHAPSDGPLSLTPNNVVRLVHPCDDGLRVFLPPQAHHALHALPPEAMPLLLDVLLPDADVLVVDAALPLVLQADLVGLADRVVLVTTAGLTDLKNTVVAAGVLDRAVHVGAVVNRLGGGEHRMFHRSAEPDAHEIERALDLPVIGVVPESADAGHVGEEPSDDALVQAFENLGKRMVDPAPFRR